MAQRIFVTGASGQIGLPLVRALVARGDRVVGLVRTKDREEAVRAAGAEVLPGSLYDADALARGVEGADRVFHLAGGTRGKGKESADQMNRVGTENLLAALAGRKLQGFVFASTMAVYGNRAGLWISEDFPTTPQTNYGRAKVAAENACLAAFKERGLPVRIARIGAVYGPGINFLQRERMAAGKGWLPGEGLNLFPVVHVDDCVRALLLIDEKGQPGEVYHIAGKSHPMLKEFYAAVKPYAGNKPMRFWSTWIPSVIQRKAAEVNEEVAARMGRKPRFTLDNLALWTASIRLRTDRLEKELGFTWTYPDWKEGVKAACGAGGAA